MITGYYLYLSRIKTGARCIAVWCVCLCVASSIVFLRISCLVNFCAYYFCKFDDSVLVKSMPVTPRKSFVIGAK